MTIGETWNAATLLKLFQTISNNITSIQTIAVIKYGDYSHRP